MVASDKDRSAPIATAGEPAALSPNSKRFTLQAERDAANALDAPNGHARLAAPKKPRAARRAPAKKNAKPAKKSAKKKGRAKSAKKAPSRKKAKKRS